MIATCHNDKFISIPSRDARINEVAKLIRAKIILKHVANENFDWYIEVESDIVYDVINHEVFSEVSNDAVRVSFKYISSNSNSGLTTLMLTIGNPSLIK